jgi:DNA-binding NtrC family response regulator
MRLAANAWPGNVRELAHELERALVFEEGPELNFAQLSGAAAELCTGGDAPRETDWLRPGFEFPGEGFSLDEAVNQFIRLAMAQSDGNVSAAARLLGVPRDFIRYRLGQKARKPDGN